MELIKHCLSPSGAGIDFKYQLFIAFKLYLRWFYQLQKMKFREILKIIENDGWRLDRQKGSHRQYKHPFKRGIVTLAGHPGDDVRSGTLNSILKQAGLK